MENAVHSSFQRTWWPLLAKGLVATVLGLTALARPHAMVAALVTIFGVFALVIGLVATVAALGYRGKSRLWWLLAAPGIVGIVIGIIALAWPAGTTVVIVYLIAIWALVLGVSEIQSAVRLLKELRGDWTPLLVGIISIVFGCLLLLKPHAASAVFARILGLFVLVLGVLWLWLASRARKWAKRMTVAQGRIPGQDSKP
jgi:uncharacterized membrane protein HdeD (DUF308 family)